MKKFNLNPYTKKKNLYEEKMKTQQLTEDELKYYRFQLYLYNRFEKKLRTLNFMIIYPITFGIVELIKNYNYKLSLFTLVCAFIYITYKNHQIKNKLCKPRKNEWYKYIVFCGISSSAVIFNVNEENKTIYFIYFIIQLIYSFYYANKAYQYGKEDVE